MANSLSTNPMIIDTADAAVIVTRTLYVTTISWVPAAGSVIADRATVKDKNGNVFWDNGLGIVGTPADTAIPPMESSFPKPRSLSGLIVSTLGSGKIYIYYDETRNG